LQIDKRERFRKFKTNRSQHHYVKTSCIAIVEGLKYRIYKIRGNIQEFSSAVQSISQNLGSDKVFQNIKLNFQQLVHHELITFVMDGENAITFFDNVTRQENRHRG
jgi:hypothetical protein